MRVLDIFFNESNFRIHKGTGLEGIHLLFFQKCFPGTPYCQSGSVSLTLPSLPVLSTGDRAANTWPQWRDHHHYTLQQQFTLLSRQSRCHCCKPSQNVSTYFTWGGRSLSWCWYWLLEMLDTAFLELIRLFPWKLWQNRFLVIMVDFLNIKTFSILMLKLTLHALFPVKN